MIVEIVCASPEDCERAHHAGANRIELVSGLAVGGLTPSLGLFAVCRDATTLPIMVMVRPREGGFLYSDREFRAMLRDVLMFTRRGANGVVFGCLHPDGRIDAQRMAELVDSAGDSQKVCHRCFDVTPNPMDALETLIALGVTRVLTSGQQPSALDGAPLIKQLVQAAAGRIEVLPAGGLRSDNFVEFLQTTQCDQIHLAPLMRMNDPSTEHNPRLSFGTADSPGGYPVVDEGAIRELVQAVQGFSR